MKRSTRIWSMLLSVVMLLGMFPVSAYAISDDADRVAENIAMKEADSSGQVSLSGNTSSGYIRNDYIEAYINANGCFTMGTVAGDPNNDADNDKKLLYGHPGGTTSDTLIRIDNQDYFFDNYVTDISFNEAGAECIATAEIGDVTVKQIITLTTNRYTGMEDVASIRYTYTNHGSTAKKIGVRIMLDTMLGYNDGAPFRVNGEDIVTETEYTGNRVPQYWQSFDSLQNPNVTSTGFFYYTPDEAPDKVQFAYWPQICGSSWDYRVTSGMSFTRDSAVAAYFYPKTVPTNGSGSVVTYYGISGFAESNTDLTAPLAVRITAPAVMIPDEQNGGYLNNPFKVSAYISNVSSSQLNNVRASLYAGDRELLRLGTSQSATLSAGNLSTNEGRALQWTLNAIPQENETTAQYSIRFFCGTIPLKVMPLELKLLPVAPENMCCTVTFRMNGGSGTIAPKQIRIGDRVPKPDNPTRTGYIFKGWYSNVSCSGMPWFSILNNNGKGPAVTGDITLYAKWEKAQELEYGKDTYDFENSDSDFFRWYELFGHKYKLTGDYYDALFAGRTEGEKTALKEDMNEKWGGSCFGMSCVLSLVRAGDLDVEFFQSNADYLHDLTAPKDSATVTNLINYYHLLQGVGITLDARGNYNKNDETDNNRAIITALKNSAYPVVVGLNLYKKRDGSRLGGHAVVAYGYKLTSNGYEVSIWDPNDKHASKTLTISEDYKTSEFSAEYDTSSVYSYMKYALTVESKSYDYRNIENWLISTGSSAQSLNAVELQETANTYTLTTNYDSFAIESSGGASAVVKNGEKISGDLLISGGDYRNEIGQELKINYTIDYTQGESYTVIPAEAESERYTTMLRSADRNTGFSSILTAEKPCEVCFDHTGAVSAHSDEAQKLSATMGKNKTTTTWYSISAETTDTDLSLSATTESAKIACTAGNTVTVTAENDYNSLQFTDYTVGSSGEVTLTERGAESGIAVLGNQIAEMGHSMIFYSMGGTSVEAQTDIPMDTPAEEPEAPTRLGYIFDGWYTDAECAEEIRWNFDTPITEDVRVYAKWLEDDNYLHTVTFRIEGMDDIIFRVADGDSISQRDLPLIPQRVGYTAMWDRTDFSEIHTDIVVTAIYQADESLKYWVTFDPNGGEGEMEPVAVVAEEGGSVFVLPHNEFVEPDGAVFKGWSYAADGEVIEGESIILTGDTVLYAIWEGEMHEGIWLKGFKDRMPYTGSTVTQNFQVYDSATLLTEKRDYTVSYKKNNTVGTATVTITFKGAYAKQPKMVLEFQIYGISLNDLAVRYNDADASNGISVAYTGKSQKVIPVLINEANGTTLKAKTDYTITYSGKCTNVTDENWIVLTGKGGYEGTVRIPLNITPLNLQDASIAPIKDATFSGKEQMPKLNAKHGKITLKSGKDYAVSYENNVHTGMATVRLTGIGNFSGTTEATFRIKGIAISKAKIANCQSKVMYTGAEVEQDISLTYNGEPLEKGVDYTVSYVKNVDVGTATMYINGCGDFDGTQAKKTFKITPYSGDQVTVDPIADQAYTGAAVTPEVCVYFRGELLQEGVDYTVKYSNNVKAADASASKAPCATITLKGSFKGKLVQKFGIV